MILEAPAHDDGLPQVPPTCCAVSMRCRPECNSPFYPSASTPYPCKFLCATTARGLLSVIRCSVLSRGTFDVWRESCSSAFVVRRGDACRSLAASASERQGTCRRQEHLCVPFTVAIACQLAAARVLCAVTCPVRTPSSFKSADAEIEDP